MTTITRSSDVQLLLVSVLVAARILPTRNQSNRNFKFRVCLLHSPKARSTSSTAKTSKARHSSTPHLLRASEEHFIVPKCGSLESECLETSCVFVCISHRLRCSPHSCVHKAAVFVLGEQKGLARTTLGRVRISRGLGLSCLFIRVGPATHLFACGARLRSNNEPVTHPTKMNVAAR